MPFKRSPSKILFTYYWWCCNCRTSFSSGENSHIVLRCLDCQHERCNNCNVEVHDSRSHGTCSIKTEHEDLEFRDNKVKYPVVSIDTKRGTIAESLPDIEIIPPQPSQPVALSSLVRALQSKFGKSSDGKAPIEEHLISLLSNLVDPFDFPLVWHHAMLPPLVQKLKSNEVRNIGGPGFAISVLNGRDIKSRRIQIMTSWPLPEKTQQEVSQFTLQLVPSGYQCDLSLNSFIYATGLVSRLMSLRGTSKDDLDEICEPQNPFCYSDPRMGDSIGLALGQGDDECTATLGPCLSIENQSYWLLNQHPFAFAESEVPQWRDTLKIIEHPSPEDRNMCSHPLNVGLTNHHSSFAIGPLTKYDSGPAYKTTKRSVEPYWQEIYLPPERVVTDWLLCQASGARVNILRFPPQCMDSSETIVSTVGHVKGSSSVCSTGRTSGLQLGKIGFCPTFVNGFANGTGHDTHEWFIEQADPTNEEWWIKGGMGISGDSGAGLLDSETNTLVGQIWGRNKYFGDGVRITYFTPAMDVFQDIERLIGANEPPQLLTPTTTPLTRSQPLCKKCVEQFVPLQEHPSPVSEKEDLIPGIDLPETPYSLDSLVNHESSMVDEPMQHDEESQMPDTPRGFEDLCDIVEEIDYNALNNQFPLNQAPFPDWQDVDLEPMETLLDNSYPVEIGEEDLYGSFYNTTRSSARKRKRNTSSTDVSSLYSVPKRFRVAIY